MPARHSNGDGSLSILTSGPLPPNPAEFIASKSFTALIDRLEAEFDVVIVDAPALLAVGDTAAIARCVDGMVFLVDLTRAKRPLLQEAANQISLMPCRKLGLVVIDKALRRSGYEHYRYDSHPPAAVVTVASDERRRYEVNEPLKLDDELHSEVVTKRRLEGQEEASRG